MLEYYCDGHLYKDAFILPYSGSRRWGIYFVEILIPKENFVWREYFTSTRQAQMVIDFIKVDPDFRIKETGFLCKISNSAGVIGQLIGMKLNMER